MADKLQAVNLQIMSSEECEDSLKVFENATTTPSHSKNWMRKKF